jgi:TolB-like protein
MLERVAAAAYGIGRRNRMRKLLVSLACLLAMLVPAFADEAADVDSAFPEMARQLSAADRRLPNKTVAVYGFEVIGRPGDSYAVYATEKLTHELVNAGKLLIIERSRLDEVLKEQNLSLSGAVDAGTAARIGKLLAVDAVITGTIRVTNTRTEFISRVIQSESGIILASADVFVSGDGETGGTKNAAAGGTGDKAAAGQPKQTPSAVKITAAKARFKPTEPVLIIFSGMPGNENDWITLVMADSPDDSWGEWFYTGGEESGSFSFAPIPAGEYEVRVYFDWPGGGYNVQQRLKITVN